MATSQQPRNWSPRLLLALFAAPFAVVAIVMGVITIGHLITGASAGAQLLSEALFALIFGGAGFGFLYIAYTFGKEEETSQTLRQQHPDAPWMWRADWAAGRIKSSTKASAISAWVFAVLLNLMSAPILVFVPRGLQKNPLLALAFIFPAAGGLLLVGAIKKTFLAKKFGESYLELGTVPGVIGGKLSGMIQARFNRVQERNVHVMLTCINLVATGSGDQRSVNEKILWREERTFGPQEIGAGPGGATIPVEFDIPSDQPATSGDTAQGKIFWRVDVSANVPGLDYKAQFEVPVYRTATSPPAPHEVPAAQASPPLRPSVEVRATARGGTEFVFPAARNPGAAVAMTVVVLAFGAVIWFGARYFPFVITGIVGVFGLAFFLIMLQLWFGTERVVVEDGRLTTRSAILGVGRTRSFDCASIAGFQLGVGMQTGGGSGTPYWDIRLIDRERRRFKICGELKDRHEADWIVAQLKTSCSL